YRLRRGSARDLSGLTDNRMFDGASRREGPRRQAPTRLEAMDSRNIRTAADARALVEARGLSHVKLGVVDLDGVIRGKYLARDKFLNALESGFKFCDVIFGWDSND